MTFFASPTSFDSKLKNFGSHPYLSEKEIFGGSLKDFKIICELGRGSFGTVYKAESLINNKECVLKKIDINSLKPKDRKNAVKEVEILKKVRHENIIKYYNSFIEENNCLYIVMEYAAGGDLQKVFDNFTVFFFKSF